MRIVGDLDMFTRANLVGLAAGLALTGMGCSGGAFSFNYYDDPPPPRQVTVVQVEPGHICTPACVHYYDGARYVVIRGKHHHGRGCGHMFDGSRWVVAVVRTPAPRVVEVHEAPAARVHPGPVRVVEIPPPPGPVNIYVFDRRGTKWLRIAKGHVHGPGCGHVHVEGHWCMP